jgi:hypothetical protein
MRKKRAGVNDLMQKNCRDCDKGTARIFVSTKMGLLPLTQRIERRPRQRAMRRFRQLYPAKLTPIPRSSASVPGSGAAVALRLVSQL